ncbi:MAG: hypothetical protein V2J51_13830 [Erythrobacter sp.]|jgi:hypothetical protein|nr:hypothetical protein [Erythrobacter sp.]
MDVGGPGFVILIVTLSILGWLLNNWIRAKHGYALEDEWGGKTERADSAEATQLRSENAELRQTIDRLEQRMRAVETIVTDRGYDVASQIEALRELPEAQNGGGVPIDIGHKEHAR